jgi:DNA invertase Pin-like site-specific DNA recombinase
METGNDQVNAGIFSRESKGKTSSIDDQDAENLQAARELGIEPGQLRWFRDKVSASRFGTRERADWPKVAAAIEAGEINLLILWEISRGDRNLETWVPFVAMCRRAGARIHVTSSAMTYDPRIAAHWRALVDGGVDAAFESEKISERSRRGIRSAVLAGQMAARPPYGYTRVYDSTDRRKFTHEPNEDAAVVREIITRIARRDPIVTITSDLNARGIPSPTGGSWHRKSVRLVGTNLAYVSVRQHHGQEHPGNWPALVDPETFYAAQNVLNEGNRRSAAPGAHRWLLSYLATGPCGGPMRAVPGHRRGGTPRRPRYSCLTDACAGADVEALDEWVTRLVIRRLAEPDARALFERSDEVLAEARGEVARLEAALKAARESYAAGGISEIALGMREKFLIAQLEKAKAKARDSASPAAALLLDVDGFTVEEIQPVWMSLSVAARRAIIKDLVAAIVVQPATTRLSRSSTNELRLLHVAERTVIDWVQ